MKSDLAKLIALVWMSAMVFFVYNIWIDIHYIAELAGAYIKMMLEHIRH